MMMVFAMFVIMVVIVVLGDEEVRLDVENAVEIEGAPLKHVGELDVAFVGAMERSVRVDRTDARASTSLSSPGVTRSVLLMMMTSANAIWFLASGASRSRAASHFASATVTTASSRAAFCTSSSTKKVCATGAGSARPVVSTMIASNLPFRFISPSMMRMRSPRTVQQMQPLFISNTSSSAPMTEFVVDPDLAEFIDDDRVALAVRLAEDAVEERRLAGAEIAGEDGDGNFLGLVAFGHAFRLLIWGAIRHIGPKGAQW